MPRRTNDRGGGSLRLWRSAVQMNRGVSGVTVGLAAGACLSHGSSEDVQMHLCSAGLRARSGAIV